MTKHGTPSAKELLHPLVTKLGLLQNEESLMPRQFTPVTKHGTPSAKKLLHPLVTKSGSPYAPVTK